MRKEASWALRVKSPKKTCDMDDGPVALLVRTTSLGPPRFPTLFHFELLLVLETVCKERDTVVVDS